MGLATMMGLVVEEMRQCHRQRIGEPFAAHVGIAEAAGQRRFIQAVAEGKDLGIFRLAGLAQAVEILVQDLVKRDDMRRDRAFEAAEPDAVADQDMVQGGMQAAEKLGRRS